MSSDAGRGRGEPDRVARHKRVWLVTLLSITDIRHSVYGSRLRKVDPEKEVLREGGPP